MFFIIVSMIYDKKIIFIIITQNLGAMLISGALTLLPSQTLATPLKATTQILNTSAL